MARQLAGVVVCYVLVVLVMALGLATPGMAAEKEDKFPVLEVVLGQDFEVSVMTESFGTFNATLRLRGSPSFPERLQGELIPHGNQVFDSIVSIAGSVSTERQPRKRPQHVLPHFARERDLTDEKLSSLSPVMDGDPAEKERPSLFVVELQLRHSNSPQGTANFYYLPADHEQLEKAREAINDGSAVVSASTTFAFRQEAPGWTGVLSPVEELARSVSADISIGDSAADVEGDAMLHFFSEHEFSLSVRLPILSGADAQYRFRKERIWVHGYTHPSKDVYDGNVSKQPWWAKYATITIFVLAFFIQIMTGVQDGKKSQQQKKLANAAAVQKKIK